MSTLLDETEHWLYVGVTKSGKTTLARLHARLLSAVGHRIIVYDPVGTGTLGGSWPKAAHVFNDLAQFDAYMKHARNAYVFVDEAADAFNLQARERAWLLRRGRHRDLYMRLIATRPKNIAPNVRTQVSRVFMFRLARDDARELCADMGHGIEDRDVHMSKGDFYMYEAGSPRVIKGNVFRLLTYVA